MIRVLEGFARNKVAANLLMWLVVLAGLANLRSLPKEVFPEVSSGLISVTVEYQGAAPEEVEEAICARIEERLEGVDGIERVRSVASEGLGTVTLELLSDADLRRTLDDVKARVDTIDTFPQEAEKPIIREVVLRNQVLSVAVSGRGDEKTLRRIAEDLRGEIALLEGVSQVELAGARPYEIAVEISEDALRRHRLTFDTVADAIRRSSIDLPGGSIKTDAGEILLRTEGQAYRGADFEEIVLLNRPDGTRLMLGQVAKVVDGFAESDVLVRFDGRRAILIQVFRVGDQDVRQIADHVKKHVELARGRLPEGIDLAVWKDDSYLLKSRLAALLENGLMGLFLVLLVLTVTLEWRLAFWVSIGIVVSFLGAFVLMPFFRVSINVHSVFAFIIVLGIVVDDAIVVGENIFRYLEAGFSSVEAAIEGVREVYVPVLFSILTTIAAFVPLTMASSSLGRAMRVIPIIVICTLLVSLLESLLILPAHLSSSRYRKQQEKGIGQSFEAYRKRWFLPLAERLKRNFEPLLDWTIQQRYTTIAIAVALLLFSIGWIAGGRLNFLFFPPAEADHLVALVTMPPGTSAEDTRDTLARLERSARELERELVDSGQSSVVRHILTSVGAQPSMLAMRRLELAAMGATSHLGEVDIELLPAEEREISATELNRRWRELTGSVPEALEVKFEASLLAMGAPIDVQFSGPDLISLRAAAADLKEALKRYPGVVDIADSLRPGKEEVRLEITPQAESLGLSLFDLARQVRQAFYGEEVQRVQRGSEEVKVMLRYPEAERLSLANLEQMRVRSPRGGEVPFAVAAEVVPGRGLISIDRANRQRTVRVTADVEGRVANSNEILGSLREDVLPTILAKYGSLSYSFEGLQQMQRDTVGSLLRGFLMILFVIYVLLAIPFSSYLQPFLIMSAIPFGFIGAVGGHVLMGHDLSVSSLFGLVALTGVVVNDSLILTDFINRHRASGDSLEEAIRQAGKERFRPIVLTSLTTFAGLMPLLLENSVQAQFLIPMAISLGFGILFATVITLLLVPAFHLVLEDLKQAFSGLAS